MLVTFKCGVCADVMMFGEVAKQMMQIIGKTLGPRGVITVEQMPDAIARLRQAIEEERRLRAAGPAAGADDGEDDQRERIGIAQRALPLIELLECSLREEVAVTWGV